MTGYFILKNRLAHAVNTLNPSVPDDVRQQAIREITTVASPDLIATNETFHNLLTNGIDVEFQKEGDTRGDKIWLVERIKSNVTIDWNIKENVRTKMKVIVKRLLRKYGYPPDMQALATKMVLVQDDMIHSKTEKRYYALGKTDLKRTLFIAFTVRNNFIRVISARDMSRKEGEVYNNE